MVRNIAGHLSQPFSDAFLIVVDGEQDAVLSRGERIELLIDKTDSLSTNARAFRNSSAQIRRTMWWKNVKVMILIGLSGLVRRPPLFSRGD